MKTTVTHREIEMLNGILRRYGTNTGYPWFAYGVSRNISALTPFISALEDARKPSEEEIEFQTKRQELLEKHGKKDERGNVIKHPINLPGGQSGYRFEFDDEAKYHAIEAAYIKKHYPDMESNAIKRMEAIKTLIEQAVEVDLHVLKMSDAPKDLISGNDMVLLLDKGILDCDIVRAEDSKKVKPVKGEV